MLQISTCAKSQKHCSVDDKHHTWRTNPDSQTMDQQSSACMMKRIHGPPTRRARATQPTFKQNSTTPGCAIRAGRPEPGNIKNKNKTSKPNQAEPCKAQPDKLGDDIFGRKSRRLPSRLGYQCRREKLSPCLSGGTPESFESYQAARKKRREGQLDRRHRIHHNPKTWGWGTRKTQKTKHDLY